MSGNRPDVELTPLSDLEATPHASVFDRDEPRVIRLALESGESVPAHDHPDSNVVIALRSGELDVSLDGVSYTLNPWDVLRFDGEREVEPHAVEDSEALVVLGSK